MSKFGMPRLIESDNPVPDKVMGYVSVQGKDSVFSSKGKGLHKTSKAYHADKKDRDMVRRDLEKSGFQIIEESALGMSVFALPGAFEELTGGKIQPKEKLMQTTNGVSEYITFLDIVGDKQPKALCVGSAKSKSSKIDGVVLERPCVFHAVFPSPVPPNSPKYHLRLPNDVAVALGVLPAHQQGWFGEGVTVVMPVSTTATMRLDVAPGLMSHARGRSSAVKFH